MLSFQLFRNVEVCSKTFKKRNFRILWTPVGTGLSTPRDGAITPVAGLMFETKNRAIFLERIFGRGITAREQLSRAVILARF